MDPRNDFVSATTASLLLRVSKLQFFKMEKAMNFERHTISPRKIRYSLSDVLERIALASGEEAISGLGCVEDAFFIDQREAARRLGIAVNTFRIYAARVGLKRLMIGKRGVRYRWTEVREKLAQVQF